ncbi:alpha/beta fold hydrolase [Microbacterium chocolatum]|uniref:alpha/beta hydrolase family protein n=1 Tax=Microbacterium aurantiacum TaxID=162393 RepID=UPI00338FD7A9
MSGLLYVPESASAENPAPGILAVHGYVNSREMQLAPAIELSRRGYVVLSIDQSGHGRSDAPAFANGFNGPAGLAYLRSLDIVDVDNIGLTGHSLGGATVVNAAAAFPEGYTSMVLLDSATGFFGPDGTPDFPRNTLVVFAQWEEFSGSMWDSPNTYELEQSEKLMTFFGTDEPVVAGELYGSIEDGTARELVRPMTNHPGATHDIAATQDIIDWFDATLDGGGDAAGQTWWVKEIGTLVAMIGGVLAIFATAGLLLRAPYFSRIRRPVPTPAGSRWGWPWLLTAAVTTGIPALTFIWFNTWGAQWVPAGPVFAQSFTTGIVIWALLNGVIGLVIYAVTRAVRRSAASDTAAGRALGAGGGVVSLASVIGRAAVLALASVGAAYLLVVLSDWLFTSDFRFYVLQLQPLDAAKFGQFLVYLVPFAIFFLTLAFSLHTSLRWTGRQTSLRAEMIANAIVLPAGFIVLEMVLYVPLFVSGQLAFPNESLLTIVAYPFIPVLAVVGLLSTYLFHRTGTIYAGAFAAALLVTWNVVGGTAAQGVVEEWSGTTLVLRTGVPLVLAVAFLVVGVVARRRSGALGAPAGAGASEEAAPAQRH